MSEQLVLDAAIAVLSAGSAFPMTLQQAKDLAELPDYYTVVSVADRVGGELRKGVSYGTRSYRITARQVARTEDAARLMRTSTRSALEYVELSVGAVASTAVMFESADPIAEDNEGWWSGLTTWTTTV